MTQRQKRSLSRRVLAWVLVVALINNLAPVANAEQVFDRSGFEGRFLSLTVPGLNVDTAFVPVPVLKTTEYFPLSLGSPTTNTALVNNAGYLIPIRIKGSPLTLDTFKVNVSVQAGGTPGTYSRFQYAIYSDDGTGNSHPGALLADLGTVSVLTTGEKAAGAFTQAISADGTYWLMVAWQTDYTGPTSPTVASFNIGYFPLATTSTTPWTGAKNAYLTSTTLTGAPPANISSITSRAGTSNPPWVGLRRQ